MIAYPVVAAAATIAGPPPLRSAGSWAGLLAGIPLALFGYQLGGALLGSRPAQQPPDSMELELLALAGVVAPAEELVWGRSVETEIGVPATAILFAAKHIVIDRKWRRGLGLALFWTGLGLVRRRSPALALGIHVAANASGVVMGHAARRDYF